MPTSYSIPGYLLPVVDALGVSWPDIDEDDVSAVGDDFRALESAVTDLGLTVMDILSDLNRADTAKSLLAIAGFWHRVQTSYLSKAAEALSKCARFCDDGYNAIHTYKAGLLGYLTIELGAIIDSGGLMALWDVVEHKAVKRTEQQMLEDAVAEVKRRLLDKIKAEIHHELEPLLSKVAAEVVEVGDSAIGGSLPGFSATASTQRMAIAEDHLAHAGQHLDTAYTSLEAAARNLVGSLHRKSFHKATSAHADSTLRALVVAVLTDVADEVRDCVTGIGQHLLHTLLDRLQTILNSVLLEDVRAAGIAGTI